HRRRRRQRARSLPDKQHLANRARPNDHRVVLVAHRGERMALGHLASLDAELNAAWQPPRAGDVTDHATTRARLLDLLPVDIVDAVNADSRMRGAAERELGEDLQLLQRIRATDIERRVRLREAALLRQ